MRKKKFLVAVVFSVFAATLTVFFIWSNPGADPDPERYAYQISEFGHQDELVPPKPGSIVFVGSSSIRGWELVERFPDFPAVNRGFGGSEISDVNYYIEDLVLKYDPSVVVLYAGENDISGRKTANQLLEDYRRFVERVTEHNSETDIIYISIKPSPKRMKIWAEIGAANEKIRKFSACNRDYHFVDITRSMLNSDAEPKSFLYKEDGIHMTAAGYDIWTAALKPLLLMINES